jgi:hypothetical protein
MTKAKSLRLEIGKWKHNGLRLWRNCGGQGPDTPSQRLGRDGKASSERGERYLPCCSFVLLRGRRKAVGICYVYGQWKGGSNAAFWLGERFRPQPQYRLSQAMSAYIRLSQVKKIKKIYGPMACFSSWTSRPGRLSQATINPNQPSISKKQNKSRPKPAKNESFR